jgi:hypothetical protein
VTWVICNLLSIRLEIVLVSVQDRCTVSAKRTIGLEIILDAPQLLGEGHLESRFGLFVDGVSVGAR